MRTFIAAAIPPTRPLCDLLRRMEQLGDRWHPVAPRNLHVTLKFLGETDRAQLETIAGIMRQIASGYPGQEMALSGMGAFPHAGRPSVVWVGLKPADMLARLASELEAALAPLGFAPEERPFQAHVTLLRVKSRPPPALLEWLVSEAESDFGAARVEEIALYESELAQGGPKYTVRAKAPLGRGA